MQADIDNSGTIDYGEFLAATLHLNKMEREENLVAAFSFFDKDGSGYITIDELQQACKEFGLGDVQLDEVIREIDQDNVSIFRTVDLHINPRIREISLALTVLLWHLDGRILHVVCIISQKRSSHDMDYC